MGICIQHFTDVSWSQHRENCVTPFNVARSLTAIWLTCSLPFPQLLHVSHNRGARAAEQTTHLNRAVRAGGARRDEPHDQPGGAGQIRPKESGVRLIRVSIFDHVESTAVRPKTGSIIDIPLRHPSSRRRPIEAQGWANQQRSGAGTSVLLLLVSVVFSAHAATAQVVAARSAVS